MDSASLPVAPFENYMLDDDRCEHPMVFFVRTRLSGRLDRSRFEVALARAQSRHALLSSVIDERDGYRVWRRLADAAAPVVWQREAVHDDPTSRGLDLRRQPGLRVWVDEAAGEASVLWEFHHSCCDGTGAMQLVEDALLAYAAKPGREPAWRTLAGEEQSERHHFGLSRAGRWLRLPLNMLGSLGVLQFFVNRPRPLAAPAQTTQREQRPAAAGQPATQSHRFSAAEVRRLKAAAHEQGVTINDLLLADLFMSLDGWQAEHEPAYKKPCLRISMPVNLRTAQFEAQSAANVVSMVFLDRRPRWYRGRRGLLRTIRRDTWFIKKLRLGLVFTAMLAFFQRICGGMNWLLDGDKCHATAVLSNLGPQLGHLPVPYVRGKACLGDVRLEQVELLPPVRHQTRAALGVVTYGGELTLSLYYDAAQLTAAAAASFFARYVTAIETTAATATAIEPVTTPPTVRVPAPTPHPHTASVAA